jgi:hypothetical protein
MPEPASISCPYCGETFETFVDAEEGESEYIEDCQVCCRPITIRVNMGMGGEMLDIEVRRDDE